MVLHRILVVRTPAHRVAALDHIIEISQYAELPFDELAVSGISGGELSPPVYGVADGLHCCFGLASEIEHYLLRRIQAGQLLLRNAMQPGVDSPDERIFVGYELGQAHDGRSCGMKPHREEDIVAPHPLVAGICISYGECAGVTGMQITIQIRIGYGQEKLLALIRLRLKDRILLPDPLPLGLDFFCGITFKQYGSLQTFCGSNPPNPSSSPGALLPLLPSSSLW